MKIACPSCGKFVPGADIDLVTGRALCRPCGELVALPLPPPDVSPAASLAVLHRPADLAWSEEQGDGGASMTVRPSRWRAIPVLGFAAIWNTFLVVFYALLLRGPRTPSVALLFPLLHVAAGVFITWYGLVRLLNRTRIAVDRGGFVLAHGPIPMRGARAPLETIDGFDTIEAQGKSGVTSQVRLLTRDGRATKLPLSFDAPEHTRFVAARLNAALAVAREPRGYRDGGGR